jgi:hypothetical protein
MAMKTLQLGDCVRGSREIYRRAAMSPFFYLGHFCGFLFLPVIMAFSPLGPSNPVSKVRKPSADIIFLEEYRRRKYP